MPIPSLFSPRNVVNALAIPAILGRRSTTSGVEVRSFHGAQSNACSVQENATSLSPARVRRIVWSSCVKRPCLGNLQLSDVDFIRHGAGALVVRLTFEFTDIQLRLRPRQHQYPIQSVSVHIRSLLLLAVSSQLFRSHGIIQLSTIHLHGRRSTIPTAACATQWHVVQHLLSPRSVKKPVTNRRAYK